MRLFKSRLLPTVLAACLALCLALGFSAGQTLAEGFFGSGFDGPGSGAADDEALIAQIEGTWVVDSVIEGETVYTPEEYRVEGMTMTFGQHGAFSVGNDSALYEGDYMVADGLIVANANGATELFVLDGDKLVGADESGAMAERAIVFVRAGGPDVAPPGTGGDDVDPASADNPVGVYDPDAGVYVNAFFGIARSFGQAWDVQGYYPDEVDSALEEVLSAGAKEDLVAFNYDDMQIVYSMVVLNTERNVIDDAFVEEYGPLFAQLFMETDGSMDVVGSSSGTRMVSSPDGSFEMPTLHLDVIVTQGGAEIPVFVEMGFMARGDYILMLAAITYGDDNTGVVLDGFAPYSPGAAPGPAELDVLGRLDMDAHLYSNGFFGIEQSPHDAWVLCGAGIEDEVAFAAESLANNGVATDVLMQNTTTGEVVAGLVLANEEGAGAVDEQFAMDWGDFAFSAFLNASGIVDDPTFFGEDFSYLMNYAFEVDPAILTARGIEVEESGSFTLTRNGADIPAIYATCTADTELGELPLYVAIAYIAKGDHVYLLGAASYDVDSTGALLQTFGTGETPGEPVPGTEGTGNGGDQGADGWTTEEVRYAFEHDMLPRYFYDNPQNLIDHVLSDGVFILWESVATENGADVRYGAGDYAETLYTYDDGTELVQLDLPEPDASLLCYRIYLLYNPNTGEAGYYTVESDDFLPGEGFVCMWDAQGNHVNFGATLQAPDKGDPAYGALLADEAAAILAITRPSDSATSAG